MKRVLKMAIEIDVTDTTCKSDYGDLVNCQFATIAMDGGGGFYNESFCTLFRQEISAPSDWLPADEDDIAPPFVRLACCRERE